MKLAGALPVCFLLCSAAVLAHEPATTAPAPAAGGAEGRRADLAVFRERFLARDRSYSEAAREEAEARLARLEADAASVSPPGPAPSTT